MSRRAAHSRCDLPCCRWPWCHPAWRSSPLAPASSPPAARVGYPTAHYHTSPGGPAYALPEASRALGRPGGAPNGVFDPGPIYGLPRGRRYYGGRFFGSFNNRFYGPQYGNF